MKHFIVLAALLVGSTAFSQNYPVAKKTPKTITSHSITYTDDYTWLEDMRSTEVETWTDAQNDLFKNRPAPIHTEKAISKKIREYDEASGHSIPIKKGKYFYLYMRRDKNTPSSLYYLETLNSTPAALPDFLRYYDKGASITGYYPSDESTLLAVKISPDGGDGQEVKFADIKQNKLMNDVLKGIKYSGISWKGEEGVFYKRNANTQAFAADSTYQLYYHVMGAAQDNDKLVYDTSAKKTNFTFWVDENYLFISEDVNNDENKDYYYLPLDNLTAVPVKFMENAPAGFKFIDYKKGRVYYSTNQYDWGEVRSRGLTGNDEKIVIPQFYNQLLTGSYFLSEYVVCKYKTLGKYHLSVYDTDMNFIKKYDLPPGMDCKVQFYDRESNCLYVTVQSYTLSPQNYTLNLQTGEFKPFYNKLIKAKPTLFPLDYFETKTITFKSRDNKDIPITIVHKKGLVMDGNNPTLLKGYGGFGSVSGPYYDSALLYFLEQGGVFAFAEVRGGGEKGLKWHSAGAGKNKVNAINDFVDAAAFLIAEKYTSAGRLGITGTSHGGLLVCGAITQRPELFKAAISKMGVTDVPQVLQYTVGAYHLNEFGNPAIKVDYENMLAYSPYQNVKPDVNYPALLLITGENDDRLPPMQSYKFAAKVQNRPAQKNVVYLKTMKASGHYGAVSTYNQRVEEKAEFYSFLLNELMK